MPEALKYWKISLILIFLSTTIYAFHQIDGLEQNAYKDSIHLEQLKTDIDLLAEGVEVQNTAIRQGNVKYKHLLLKQESYISRIVELDQSLLESLSTITAEPIGSACEDKIQYLRDSASELSW